MELGRILKIEQNITKASLKVIKAFHKFVFENDDGRNNRRNLRRFEGFDFKDDNDERLQAKINFAMNNLTLGELNSICQILCVDNDANDKKELVEMLCGKLSDLELKNLDDDIHDDGSGKDVDTTHIERKKGKSDDESELEMADISKSNNMSDGEQSFTKNFENNSKTFHPKFMLTFKDIEETLCTFDGAESHSINKWIVEFVETSLMMGWNEVEKLIYGKRLMKGEALLFIRAEKGITSWTALKTKLIKEFGRTTNSAVIHKRLTTRKKKKDETLWQYLMKMREIAAEGDIEEEVLIEYVTEGIVDDEINKTILYGPTTLKEFKEKLKMYERLKEKQGREHRDTKKEDFMRQNNTKQTQRKQDTIKERDERNMRCFNCGKGGHQAKNCRDKDKGLKCFKCDNFGHIAKECEREKPQRKNSNRDETKELYVAQETKMELSRYKTVILNGRKINGFIDTGSDLNLIKVTAFLQIGGPKFDETPITIKGIGDNCITTLGKFKTEMKMDDCIFATDIHIVPEEAIPMKFIIGKPVLEFATLTINNKGIKVTENGENKDFIMTREIEKEREVLSDIFMIQMDSNTLNVGKLGCYKRISNIVQAYKPQHRQSTAIRTKIILSDEIPVYQSPRRLSFMEKKEVERQIEEWIADGIVRPSISDYASPIVLVKKRDGSTRICIDYRKLNRKIIKDRYPLPVIEDQINRLAKAKIFTTLDLKNGFFHVPVDEYSVKYTSFVTPSGQYEFLKTPFGLCNSPAVFQRYVNEVFKKLIHKGIVLTYMDDLIIPSTTVEEAYSNLEEVLKTAENYGLEFKWSKCYFIDTKVEYLGHEVEDGTVKPSLRKIKAVMNFPIPTTIKKV
nr:uncharacterized protein LOC111414058 [Onthophagus taurus]